MFEVNEDGINVDVTEDDSNVYLWLPRETGNI